jgi:hypothetical protein
VRFAFIVLPAVFLGLFVIAVAGFLMRPKVSLAAFGDVNCDGRVNAIDSLLVLQYSAGLLRTLDCLGNADANGDGRINSLDAALILQHDAQLIGDLPGPISPPMSRPISSPISPPVRPTPTRPAGSPPISVPSTGSGTGGGPLAGFFTSGQGLLATGTAASLAMVGAMVGFGGLAGRRREDEEDSDS